MASPKILVCKCEMSTYQRLTVLVGGEKDAEATFPTGLVSPHTDDPQCGDQHQVVGHCGAVLALQVFHRTEMEKTKIDRLYCNITSAVYGSFTP